jgi:hypothetical protein
LPSSATVQGPAVTLAKARQCVTRPRQISSTAFLGRYLSIIVLLGGESFVTGQAVVTTALERGESE